MIGDSDISQTTRNSILQSGLLRITSVIKTNFKKKWKMRLKKSFNVYYVWRRGKPSTWLPRQKLASSRRKAKQITMNKKKNNQRRARTVADHTALFSLLCFPSLCSFPARRLVRRGSLLSSFDGACGTPRTREATQAPSLRAHTWVCATSSPPPNRRQSCRGVGVPLLEEGLCGQGQLGFRAVFVFRVEAPSLSFGAPWRPPDVN